MGVLYMNSNILITIAGTGGIRLAKVVSEIEVAIYRVSHWFRWNRLWPVTSPFNSFQTVVGCYRQKTFILSTGLFFFPKNPRPSSRLGDRRTVYDPDQLPRHRASSIAMVFTATIVSFDLSRTWSPIIISGLVSIYKGTSVDQWSSILTWSRSSHDDIIPNFFVFFCYFNFCAD